MTPRGSAIRRSFTSQQVPKCGAGSQLPAKPVTDEPAARRQASPASGRNDQKTWKTRTSLGSARGEPEVRHQAPVAAATTSAPASGR